LKALEITNLQMLCADGAALSGPQASALKIAGSEVHQSISELAMRVMGPYAARDARSIESPAAPIAPWLHDFDGSFSPTYFNMRKTTIYGGSSEVQKNIIAQTIGL